MASVLFYGIEQTALSEFSFCLLEITLFFSYTEDPIRNNSLRIYTITPGTFREKKGFLYQ
jgi:hypothetical protein